MKTKQVLKVASLLLISIVLFAGCISEKKATTNTPAPTTVSPTTPAPTTVSPTTAAPKKEHVLIYTFWEVMATWDPAYTFDSTVAMTGECYEFLVRYDQTADPPLQPLLATSWDQSEDKLTWTFYLRKGVKFHTGREMTADDVKYSIERTIDIGEGAAWIWDGLESIEIVDPYTVKFHTEYPMNIPLIASAANGAYILDSEEVKSKGSYEEQTAWFQQGHECGTGPYYVYSWVPTQQVVFKKFDDYWGGWEGKHYDTAIMKYVTEGSTMVQMLEGGEVQIIHDPPIDLIPVLERNKDILVKGFPSYWNMVIQLNCKKPPTNELAVRKALSYTWDYEGDCRDIWKGYAVPAKGPVPRGVWGRPEDLPTYSFDIEKAKQILENAGWKDNDNDGIREKGSSKLIIRITCFENEVYRKEAEYWQSLLKEVGFEVHLNVIPFDTAWSRAKNFDTSPNVFMLDWWPNYVTPFDMLYSMFYSGEIGAFNCAYYENNEFDNMLMKGHDFENVGNMEEAAKVYGDAQRKLIEDAAAIFAWDRLDTFAYNKSIAGLNPNPAYPMTLFIYNVSWKE